MSDGQRRVPVVPWSWGHGPRPRDVPLPVVLRAIRTGDLAELERASVLDDGVARSTSPARRRSRSRVLRLASRALLGGAGLVGGLALVVLLVLLGGA